MSGLSASAAYQRHIWTCEAEDESVCPEGAALAAAARDEMRRRGQTRTEPCEHSETITLCVHCLEEVIV